MKYNPENDTEMSFIPKTQESPHKPVYNALFMMQCAFADVSHSWYHAKV